MNEIADLDRLRGQARNSCAPVTPDQQSVWRLSRIDVIQQQAIHIADDLQRQQRHTALLARGSRKTCSQCGKGPLLTGDLKPQASCSACKEDFSHISADDGPAWLALLIVGNAVVPLMLFFGRSDVVPL